MAEIKRNTPFYFLIILLIGANSFVSSCEKEIPLEQDEIEPRIVVNGLFSAGDTIYIHVSESRDVLYEGELPNIITATAKLYDNNNALLGDFTHEGYGLYKLSNYLPVAGMTYNLAVSNPGFTDVTAQTNTPSVISVNTVDTLRKGNNMAYEIKFNDDPSMTNYYAVTLKKIVMTKDEFSGSVFFYEEPWFTTTEIFVQNGSADVDGSKWGDIFLFSDASFNGGTCSFSAENNLFGQDYADTDSVAVVVGLRSVSEDYFKYSISLSKYQETVGDPFAQPVQVYSNVENGFGIFGAYSAFTDTLIIE